MVIGGSDIESSDKGKITDITTRVKDLTARLNDIRREQVFQRVSYEHHETLLPLSMIKIYLPHGHISCILIHCS